MLGIRSEMILAVILPAILCGQDKAVGDWLGSLKVQGFELRIVFHLQQVENGLWKATMDSPDQGASGVKVDSVFTMDRNIRLVISRVQGEFEGVIDQTDTLIRGSWRQSGMSIPLDLKRATQSIEVKRPQEPKGPYPYLEEEVEFANKEAGITLAGTLTLPKTTSPVPAAVLISGSGPQDRDENIFNHRPFKVIADYLTRNGIAVLRYDDRGIGRSKGSFGTATSADFATDAQAAVRYLSARIEIDKNHIGLIGHSEGGIIAPITASSTPEVSFIVMLAGPSLMGRDIILLQDSLISLANGLSIDKIRENRKIAQQMYSILEAEKDSGEAGKRLRMYLGKVSAESADQSATPAQREAGIQRTVSQLTSPWFRFFLFYDPVPALRKLRCAVLALNGEKDLQVPSKVNLEGIREALRQGGNNHVTAMELPGLNHLFQHAQTGSPLEYPKIEETFAPEALAIMKDWILRTVK